jgi:hypothetical protein
MKDLRCNLPFLKEQIKETKRVLAKSKYTPYRKELKKDLKKWKSRLRKAKKICKR